MTKNEDYVYKELEFDLKKLPKDLKITSIGKRSDDETKKPIELHCTVSFESQNDSKAKEMSGWKYGLTYHNDYNDKYVWYVQYLRNY